MSAGSQSALREANAARLLDAVRRFGSMTQVELVEATNLSAATISTIVKQLLALGVIETRTTTRSGRRAQLVTLAHTEGLLVGVHVGIRSVRIVVTDTAFTTLGEQSLPLRPDHQHDTTLDRVALLIVEQVESLGSAVDEVLGIGVGLPAPVNPITGHIAARGLLRGWEDLSVVDKLSARLHRPVHVDKDANLGALAEARFGAGRGFGDILYVRASFNTSVGVVVNGELHRGPHGTVGEIGHILVDPLGHICRCGSRGCLDTVVGAQSLIDALRVTMGPINLSDLLRLAEEGDPGCRQVLADAGAIIGTHVANLAVATDPAVVILGGELAATEDLILEPLRSAIARRVVLSRETPLEVRAGELGDAAEVRGALAAAADLAHIPQGGS
jgi:predicted NBD/HSP70 family sugar kinase